MFLCSAEDRETIKERISTSIPSHFVKITLYQGQVVLCKQQSRVSLRKDAQTEKAQRHFPPVKRARESMNKNEWKQKQKKTCESIVSLGAQPSALSGTQIHQMFEIL